MTTPAVLKTIQYEINRFFRRPFFHPDLPVSFDESSIWRPEIDIEDSEDHYLIKANIPGAEPENVKVQFHKGMLSLKGKVESKKEEKGKNYIQCERSSGEFYRSFFLPDVHEDAKIEAKFKNGVLEISVPKSKVESEQYIEIQHG